MIDKKYSLLVEGKMNKKQYEFEIYKLQQFIKMKDEYIEILKKDLAAIEQIYEEIANKIKCRNTRE